MGLNRAIQAKIEVTDMAREPTHAGGEAAHQDERLPQLAVAMHHLGNIGFHGAAHEGGGDTSTSRLPRLRRRPAATTGNGKVRVATQLKLTICRRSAAPAGGPALDRAICTSSSGVEGGEEFNDYFDRVGKRAAFEEARSSDLTLPGEFSMDDNAARCSSTGSEVRASTCWSVARASAPSSSGARLRVHGWKAARSGGFLPVQAVTRMAPAWRAAPFSG